MIVLAAVQPFAYDLFLGGGLAMLALMTLCAALEARRDRRRRRRPRVRTMVIVDGQIVSTRLRRIP